jgi:tetratricopeptide (TPR) repeat protein
MAVRVKERTIEEVAEKLLGMSTVLNKISYLESVLKSGVAEDLKAKRFIWSKLARLYEDRKMFDRAARAFSSLAGIELMFRDKMDSYVMSAEMFCFAGKIQDAEEMFNLAVRGADEVGRQKVLLARKNVYFKFAKDFEKRGKRGNAVKFYEKLNTMKLDEVEKEEVLRVLKISYNALGMFREARLLKDVK